MSSRGLKGAQESFVGDVNGGVGQVWFHDAAGVRQAVPHVVVDSPIGLSWGYAGNGPADTARSILAAETGDAATAERYQEDFTTEVVASLPLNGRFALSRADVRSWLAAKGYNQELGVQRRRARPASAVDDPPDTTDLGRRMAQLVMRGRALDERERRLAEREARVDALAVAVGLIPEVPQATWLPAEPVRHQLEALAIDSGADIAEVAWANNLDPAWATAVVTSKVARVDLAHVRQVCEGLRCTPYDLWGTAGARSIAYAYGPAEWPAQTEPLIAVDGTAGAALDAGPVPGNDRGSPPGEPVGPDLDAGHDIDLAAGPVP